MLYRIHLNLAFNDESNMDDIRDKALDHLGEAVPINPGTPFEERGFIIIQHCYHDETPQDECHITEEHWTPE